MRAPLARAVASLRDHPRHPGRFVAEVDVIVPACAQLDEVLRGSWYGPTVLITTRACLTSAASDFRVRRVGLQ
jgi:hypothetical protein